jgi:HSP20 family protein
MRMRYRHVTYRFIDGSQKQMEQYYHRLLNDALHQSQQSLLLRSTTWRPAADILESAEMLIIKVELAGMTEEEIEVTLYEDALVISGERYDRHENQENLSYHEAQIRYGPFRLEVYIRHPVQRDAITAHYENGILRVELPKIAMKDTEQLRIQQSETKA